MCTSLYRRRAGVKHSARADEDVDASIMHACTSSCDVHRGIDASTDRYLQRATMDILNHIDDARALFGAFASSTGVLSYSLSTAYDAGGACTRDVDVRAYLRGSCKRVFESPPTGALFCTRPTHRPIMTQEIEIARDA
jgi:hypothetical protein